jgi:hypothetical protein
VSIAREVGLELNMSEVIFGTLAGLFGLLGAILASGAIDIGMETFGLGLIAFALLLGFWLIKDHYDLAERS